ncbi:hypothetical protein BpHYR1_008600 [Brachionus plicatilis]|uniref:UPAR/Ly6 domain-containing protein n=1 Tax=Brachionus plicatilis TaxID=10195 RepID=A0A3M7T2U6_BRAPC|nr:hypothetical protein BpHYR1_008600 [Brachionus plicatilis]
MNSTKFCLALTGVMLVLCTAHALKCHQCADCNEDSFQNLNETCETGKENCGGFNINVNGTNKIFAQCVSSDQCDKNAQVAILQLYNNSTNSSFNSIEINKVECCSTDLCIQFSNISSYEQSTDQSTTTTTTRNSSSKNE